MAPKESDPHRTPGNTPDRKTADPKLPGEEDEDIRKGAQQEDQLDKLHPDEGDDKAPGKIGSEPVNDSGEDDAEGIGTPS